MTPKEKAKELLDKYKYLYDDDGTLYLHASLNIAKRYALIAVDQLIEHSYQVMKPFWEEVKTEIEKL